MSEGRVLLASIMENVAHSKEQGFEPIIILVNNEVYNKLGEQTTKMVGESCLIYKVELKTIMGIDVIRHSKIKDFLVIDNRSWVYQKF